MDVFIALLVGYIVLASYFLPAVIAYYRGHNNRHAILVANLFTGWTGFGWIASLIWSFTGNVKTN